MFLTPVGSTVCVCIKHSHESPNTAQLLPFLARCHHILQTGNTLPSRIPFWLPASQAKSKALCFSAVIYPEILFGFCCQLAKTVPDKVLRKHGYDAPPLRIDLRASVRHAL